MHRNSRRSRPLALLDTSHDLGRCAAELGKRVDVGKLLTPPKRFADRGTVYAIDNGAFAGFDAERFQFLRARQAARRDRCRFVAAPAVE